MIKENNNSISNNSYISENNKMGHLFITIKFFKFTENNKFDDNYNNDELRVINYK